jgi:hypothetical protein
MASNTKNVKLGVCQITFDGEDLGYTKGGVEFSLTTETHKVEVDQFGKSAINEYIMGRGCSVKAPLAETTLQNMAKLIPTLANLGVEGLTSQRVAIDSGVGVDLLAGAKMLTLHPISKKAWDYSDDIIIPLANTPGALQFAYQLDNERIFDTTFTGYPDPVSGMLFFAGNPFTDASGKSWTVTLAAGDEVTGLTGLTDSITGKMVMLGATDANGALPSPLVARKTYFAKYVSATTISLHSTYDDAIAGTDKIAIAGASTATVKLALLA